jgi:hypothetical protein
MPTLSATMYARMGDKEATLRWLVTAMDKHFPDVVSVRFDPAFDLVRNEPKYQAIAGKFYGSNRLTR